MNAGFSQPPALVKAAIALAGAGVILAAYLTWVHFDEGSLVCGLGDCHTVQASEFATVGLVPVALLGLGMYLMVLAANLLIWRRPALSFAATCVAFAVTVAGAVYALYLTWLEIAVIGAICQWCVVSAILTIVLAMVEGRLLWHLLSPPAVGETGAERAAS